MTMPPPTFLRQAVLLAVASSICAHADKLLPQILPRADGINFLAPPPDLTTLPNNSLFLHWRPRAHFIAPNSWMNDPMSMWYSADGQGGGKFKMSYQAHPNHVLWGNISQASAVSDDLIHWTDMPAWDGKLAQRLTMYPSQPYDRVGVFDGSIIPKGYNGFPTLIYTGVKYMPNYWNQPYAPGTESQNLAWSEDGGVTWHKLDSNPVIGGPPTKMNITGFRDPFLFKSPILANLTTNNPGAPTPPSTFNGSSVPDTFHMGPRDISPNQTIEDPWFTLLSGGVKDVGPHILLYRQASSDLTKWVYLGQVFQNAANYSHSEWSGNWGFNFETSSLLSLGTEGEQLGADGRHFFTMGTEGGRPKNWDTHWALWIRTNLSDSMPMQHEYAGVLDWGETYAYASFSVPRSQTGRDLQTQPNRRIIFGWTYEADLKYGLQAKGWNGVFTLPREVFVKEWTVRDSRANETGSWGIVSRSGDTARLETLGTRPAAEVSKLWTNATSRWSEKKWTYGGKGINGTWAPLKTQPKSRFYVLTAKLDFDPSTPDTSAGFTIFRAPDGSEATHIYYDFAAEMIRVNRTRSSLVNQFDSVEDNGKFRLWHVPAGKTSKIETLDLMIIVDNSMVEIYANDRFTLTTRVYPWREDSHGLGYYTSGTGSVRYSGVRVYEGLTNAWPSRPANCSTQLVWDGEGYPWTGI